MLPTDIPGSSQLQPDQQNQKEIEFTPRIQSLDVLRGIAVLFALFISVWFFGGFSQNMQNGLLLSSKGFDYRLFGTVDLLFDGKMRALIALVFGAGMLLFLSKDNQKGKLSTQDLLSGGKCGWAFLELSTVFCFCGRRMYSSILLSWGSCYFLL